MAFFLLVFGIPEEKGWSFGWVLIGRAVTIAILCPEEFYEERGTTLFLRKIDVYIDDFGVWPAIL